MTAAADPAVPAAAVLRALARRRRVKPADVLYRLYLLALFSLPSAQIAIHAEGLAPTHPDAVALQRALSTWGPLLLAAALAAVARFSAWAGLVVPEAGEVAWVLTAPVRRARLLRPRLRRALLSAVLAGVLVAYLPAWFVIASVDVAPAPVLGAGLLAGATTGVLAAGTSWWVEASERRARWALRAGPWLLVLGIVLAAGASVSSPLRTALAWSGPWGWAVLPLVASAGVGPVGGAGPAGVLALGVTALVAAGLLLRADAVPLPEFARRAAPFAGVRSALFLGDARFAALVRRQAVRQLMGLPRRRLPPPRRAGLVVPWMDALGLLRSPRWAWTCAIVGLLTTFAAAASDTTLPGLVPLGVAAVGAMVAATQVLDGLRAEHNSLVGRRYLPWPPVQTMLLHLVAPAVALVLGIAVACLAALAVGARPGMVLVAASGAVLAVPPLVGFAALAATAPDVDATTLLAGGETGAAMAMTRLLLGPQLALAVVVPPALLVLAALDAGRGPGVPLLIAALWSGMGTAGVAWWLRRRLAKTI